MNAKPADSDVVVAFPTGEGSASVVPSLPIVPPKGSPDAAMARAARLARRSLGASQAFVWLAADERFIPDDPTPGLADLSDGLGTFLHRVIESDGPLTSNADGAASLFGMPIRLGKNVLAVLGVCGPPAHRWSEDDADVLNDIAETLTTELALRDKLDRAAELEERQRLVLQAGGMGTFDFDPRTGESDWDEELYGIWGLEPGTDNAFAAASKRIHVDDQERVAADIDAAFDPTGSGRHAVEMRIVNPDTGRMRWVQSNGRATFEGTTPVRMVGAVHDITERKRAEERLNLALRAGRLGIYEWYPGTGETFWDDAAYAIYGVEPGSPISYERVVSLIHPDDRAEVEADMRGVLSADGTGRRDVRYRIIRPDTGAIRWIHADGDMSFEGRRPFRLVGTVRDVTVEQEALERSRLLTRELNHRVKNLFAIVSGMIGLTARTSPDPREMGIALRNRIQALASAHALIQPAITGEAIQRSQVTFQALATTVLEPHMSAANNVSLSGPPVALTPSAASSLALVVHELATNAAKYGALSMSGGRLSLTWRFDGARGTKPSEKGGSLLITWEETEGPPVESVPKTRGFGTTLIDLTVRGQMGGTIESEWRSGGVVHRLTLPMERIV